MVLCILTGLAVALFDRDAGVPSLFGDTEFGDIEEKVRKEKHG